MLSSLRTHAVQDFEQAVASAEALGDEQRMRDASLAELYQLSLQHDGKREWYDRSVRVWERKPRIIVPLPRAIITKLDRFLWAGARRPRLQVDATANEAGAADVGPLLDKEQAEELTTFVDTLVRASKLVVAMRHAGAKAMVTGSAAIIVGVANGWVRTQVVGGKCCTPTFSDERPGDVAELAIQYKFPRTERVGMTTRENWFWYRRVIDAERDVTMREVAVRPGEDPVFEEDPERTIEHALGFCPVRWVKVLADCDDEVDGHPVIDPTLYPFFDAISYTLSRKQSAVEYGMEPQPWRRGVTEELAQKLEKTPGSVWDLPLSEGEGAGAQPVVGFLETTGSGAQRGSEHLMEMQRLMRELVGIVERDPEMSAGQITGVALRMLFEPMIQLASDLREDLGTDGLAPLVQLVLRIICAVYERGEGVWIPGVKRAYEIISGAQLAGPWLPPPVTPVWPDFIAPSEDDRQKRVAYTVQAEQAKNITRATAVRHLAEVFPIPDPAAEEEALEAEEAEQPEYGALPGMGEPQPPKGKAPSGADAGGEDEDADEGGVDA